jgi:hypothetical protein
VTTLGYQVEDLESAMAMAKASERLAMLPGVTQVTVNLAHQERSVLFLRTTSSVPAA